MVFAGVVTLPTIGIPSLVVAVLGGITALVLWFIIEASPKTPKPDTPNSKEMGETMQTIHENIAIGARAFLKQEYTALAVAAAILFILVSAAVSWKTGICYLCGVITSAACGYIGMMSATMANVRTAAAAEIGLNAALRVSFNSGSVMGLTVVSAGLGMISILLMAFDLDAVSFGYAGALGMGQEPTWDRKKEHYHAAGKLQANRKKGKQRKNASHTRQWSRGCGHRLRGYPPRPCPPDPRPHRRPW